MNKYIDIQDNTIIICENKYKKYILKKLSEKSVFLNVKFYSKKEFLNIYLFSYNEEAVYYLVNKYNIKVDIAKMYLNNLYYIDELKKYKNPKLKYLASIKRELKENNLLKYNEYSKNNLKNYNIMVIGYKYLDNNELNIFNKLNATIYQEIDNFNNNNVYEFDDIEDEINFVCKKICELLKKGININKIKLCNVSNDYYNILKRIFNFYNIPIKIPSSNTLYNNIIGRKFLDNYDSNIRNTIEKIKNENNEIVNKIVNVCNKYTFIEDYSLVKELIINDFKNQPIDNFNLKNYIEIIDVFDPVDDEYIFLMNFNMGCIPVSIKDEEYITDNIKEEVNMKSTILINKEIKNNTINKIKSIKNLFITYKLKSSTSIFYPSSLIRDMNLNIIKEEDNVLNSYSLIFDKLKYAKKLDEFSKYGNVDKNLYIYKNTFNDISYNTYDNSYKNINKNSLKEYLNNKLTLSYSSLNNYNKCAFRYYVTNILKLDKYEESFEAFIGSIFHDVLEKCFTNNLNVEDEINNYIKLSKKELTIKERFFVNKIIDDIKFVISVLNKQKEYTSFSNALYEKDIVIDKSSDIKVEFLGFVDKILYKENTNNTLVSIIDYKTGFIDIELKYLPYGLSLQLPIYLYLVKKSNLFNNPKFVGFYLQYILDKDITRNVNKTYLEEREDNLKLMGYSNSDIHILNEFDKTYENSSLIKGLKLKSNGDFSAYSKVLDDKKIDKIIDLTEKNIDEAIFNILNAEFHINPKKIGYDNDLGCKFCKFRDICFKKDSDYVILEDIKTLDFLGGEEDA